MEESLNFYHEIIGLKISERFNVGEDIEIAMLGETDGTKVELIYNKNKMFCHEVRGFLLVLKLNRLMKLWNF